MRPWLRDFFAEANAPKPALVRLDRTGLAEVQQQTDPLTLVLQHDCCHSHARAGWRLSHVGRTEVHSIQAISTRDVDSNGWVWVKF